MGTRSDDLRDLETHYDRLAREHGDTPQAAQWTSRETQEARMAVLSEIGDLRRAKILDFGCGTGHLLAYLRSRGFAGEYVGYDLSSDMLALAEASFPDARFERRDILTDGIAERFDYALVSGVFNNRVRDNWALMTSLLAALFPACDLGLAFNALSTYVDFFDDGLHYFDPGVVFQHCKEQLSPRVCLRHDYEIKPGVVPFEFTVYVMRGAALARANRSHRGP